MKFKGAMAGAQGYPWRFFIIGMVAWHSKDAGASRYQITRLHYRFETTNGVIGHKN